MGVKNGSGEGNPKKPFIYYYLLVLLIVMVLNALVFPSVMERSVQEVPYSEFIARLEDKEVKDVYVTDTQIRYTLKDKQWGGYKTGRLQDPDLLNRLQAAGVTDYRKEIPTQASPLLNLSLIHIFLADRDEEVFAPLAAAYGLPTGTEEEKAHKAKVMEERLLDATYVPLEIMEKAVEMLGILDVLAVKGSQMCIKDRGSGWRRRSSRRNLRVSCLPSCMSCRTTSP